MEFEAPPRLKMPFEEVIVDVLCSILEVAPKMVHRLATFRICSRKS